MKFVINWAKVFLRILFPVRICHLPGGALYYILLGSKWLILIVSRQSPNIKYKNSPKNEILLKFISFLLWYGSGLHLRGPGRERTENLVLKTFQLMYWKIWWYIKTLYFIKHCIFRKLYNQSEFQEIVPLLKIQT